MAEIRRLLLFALLLFVGGILPPFSAWAQDQPFYEGKTVRLIVFGTPGGGNDLWARLLARHMTNHIPGGPGFVVQNMPGAAGMIAANYLYNVAKPDGLTIGLISPALYQPQIIGQPAVKFDWSRFGWIGTPEVSAYQLYIRADTGYKTLDDIRAAKEPPICAESGAGSMNYAHIRLIEQVYGARFKPVVGYKGSGEMNAAIQRGEAVCRSTTISAVLATEPPRTWLKTGFIRVLVQSGKKRHPALPDVPIHGELAEKYRLGEHDRQLVRLVLAAADFGRPFVAPPGLHSDRLELLRKAFAGTMNDPEFLKVATRAGFEVSHLSGAELESLAKAVVATSPGLAQRLRKVLE